MPGKRLMCVLIPSFPLQVLVRTPRHRRQHPLVVTEGGGPASSVVAVNYPAKRFGVSRGLTLAQARSRCPELRVVARDHEREDEESGKVLKLLQGIAPFVEEAAPGEYYVEANGLTRLYGSESQLADRVGHDMRSMGYRVRIGIAANRLVSHVAAGVARMERFLVVADNEERPFLAPLPIEQLPLPGETIEKLHDLGINTIGQLAELPPNEVTLRFGHEIVELAWYVRGLDPAFFVPEAIEDCPTEHLILDYPVDSGIELQGCLEQLLQKLLPALAARGQGSRTVLVQLVCEDRTVIPVRVDTDYPTASSRVVMRQIHRALECTHASKGVIEIKVVIPLIEPLVPEQISLSVNPSVESKKQAVLPPVLLRGRLYAVKSRPRLLPEQDRVFVPYPPPHEKKKSATGSWTNDWRRLFSGRSISGLRLLSHPRPVVVMVQSGKLSSVRITGSPRKIKSCRGPWELSGGWWNGSFDRLYYEIESAEHQSFLLFYDRLVSRWFVQGVYD